ncbi:MAG: Gfo/Idh/MocA family oxidoreductase [Candidatus Omnitrophica bacterium]|nr:Gfo/Idh/MocA family oxidoreductase [Candidatus Omnitrophota bacterium]
MGKTKIAVVGCGSMAQGMHLPNIKKHKGLTLAWCCDVDGETLSTVREKFNPEKVTADVRDVAKDRNCKIVLISTADAARYNLIKLFAEAGKDIYVEKPVADSFKEMFAIAGIVKKTGIKLCVGHNRRMAPAIQEALRIYLKHKKNPVSPPWRWDRNEKKRPTMQQEKQTVMLLRVNDDYWSWKEWAFEEGSLLNEMTHFADLACYFIGKPPSRVTVIGNKVANHTIVIEFRDGSIATIVTAANGSFGYPKELIEIFQEGSVIAIDHLLEIRTAGIPDEPFRKVFPLISGTILKDGITGYYEEFLAAQKRAVELKDNSLRPTPADKGHYRLLDAFLKEVRGGEKTPSNLDEAMKSTAIILKAIESCRTGKPVEISPSDYTL